MFTGASNKALGIHKIIREKLNFFGLPDTVNELPVSALAGAVHPAQTGKTGGIRHVPE